MIVVIADDLTGASEIAGICLRYGISVSFGIDEIPEKEATVKIIATDSRSLSEKEAFDIHRDLSENVVQRDRNKIIFKKCDSVLRGHILTELSALIYVLGKTTVLLQPSNPVGGRCIRNGVYLVNNMLIEKTGFASDPDFPATSSSLETLLLNRSSKKVKINKGPIKSLEPNGVYVPDCNSEEDLKKCAGLSNESCIIGGSAAFFEQFLLEMKIAFSKKEAQTHSFSKDYLLVSGSTHPESVRFAKMLQENHCPLLNFPEDLLQTNLDEAILSRWIEGISRIYYTSKRLVLRISDTVIQFENSSKILKNRLSLIVKALLENGNVNDIFIEGGATAYDVLKKLNWNSFTPIAELASGVVCMQYNNNPKKYITIKPGSYQWPDGLLN